MKTLLVGYLGSIDVYIFVNSYPILKENTLK